MERPRTEDIIWSVGSTSVTKIRETGVRGRGFGEDDEAGGTTVVFKVTTVSDTSGAGDDVTGTETVAIVTDALVFATTVSLVSSVVRRGGVCKPSILSFIDDRFDSGSDNDEEEGRRSEDGWCKIFSLSIVAMVDDETVEDSPLVGTVGFIVGVRTDGGGGLSVVAVEEGTMEDTMFAVKESVMVPLLLLFVAFGAFGAGRDGGART